ncbi:MAG TPA: sigma-70 family RNA polymerase sigma factor [Gemmatimonadales bacterium]|jgi:RNA polymerase sigma-70 factor (ECF subfamily)
MHGDRNRQREEFEALLAPALDRAWATARRLTRNDADAEDLVQEAALLAYRGFGGFERGTNFGAWFLRILMNAFLSGRRKHRIEDGAVSLDDLPNAYVQHQAHEVVKSADAPLGIGASDLARSVIGRLEQEQVEAAIDMLPEEFRVVAALYFLQDQPYRDIAQLLAIPVGTVRSRLHRGRALLQKKLWETALDHGLVPGRSLPR